MLDVAARYGARYARRTSMILYDDGTIERWQQPKLPTWEVPKRNPHERRPRAPDYWEPEEAAEIAELALPSDAVTSPHRAPRMQQIGPSRDQTRRTWPHGYDGGCVCWRETAHYEEAQTRALAARTKG
jgi:hypothetical protein